jgi:uncharacterized protein YdaU (DUF1376 family)
MHYYKRNIGDYHKKAGRLSILEHGAYTLLLDACYDRERFPTLDDAIDWCWARSDAEIAAVKFVLSKFFDLIDGKYVQHRIQEEIDNYHEKAEKNKQIALDREEAKRAAIARNVHDKARNVHERAPNQEPRTTNQEPLTKNQEPKEKKKSRATALPAGFEITPDMRAWAAEKRLLIDIDYATEKWKNAMVAKETKYSDWTRAWYNGMLNAQEWQSENPKVTPLQPVRTRKEMPLP